MIQQGKFGWYELLARCALALALAGVGAAPAARAESPAEAADDAPRLVVVVVVDQLRRDRVVSSLPGGLGRLAREGRVFVRAELAHAASETCPGHAALLTGRHPGATGLPANYVIDRASGEGRYCVEDDPEAAGVLGASAPVGRSPRRMRVDALGDWMKRARPESTVVAVSAKDRSAIALAGQHPDGVYWLQGEGELGFTTSRYYARELPGWVREWNRDRAGDATTGVFAGIPDLWEHPSAPRANGRIDGYRAEQGGAEAVSPHALRDASPTVFLGNVYRSPFVDFATLRFAEALVGAHDLGGDASPDLLAVSLSGHDSVGHLYGPESHESADSLERIDAWLGDFLARLEQRVGREHLVVALSSDHGVLELPEWRQETGRGTCPVGEGRIPIDDLRDQLFWHLHFELGPWYGWPRDWLVHAGKQITVDRARAASRGVEVDAVIAAAEAWLEAQPEVVEAWTEAELAASAEPMARLFRNSRDPERSGDLVIQAVEGCLLSLYEAGTSHGSPYGYDRDVPLVLWGGGIAQAVDEQPAATVDLGPTLAELLGVEVPDDVDGRSLLERP